MASSDSVLNVLVVDDHDVVRLGVRHLLGARARIADAASLAQARQRLAEQRFDLMLLDLGLGDDFSLPALPALREAHPGMKIIVLTSMAEDMYAERVLRAGADGFVMKSALGETLLEAVETVMAGDVHVSARLGSTMLRRMAGREAGAVRPELSLREIEVLRHVAAGLSTREIAERLNRSVKTVETHKQSLKTKLGAETPAKLVRLAMAWCQEA